MSETGLCAWTFQQASDSKFKDPFCERFKMLIGKFGLNFPQETEHTRNLNYKLMQRPHELTKEDFSGAGYPFIDVDKGALLKLMTGHVEFTSKEAEALEAVCGDFFSLKGMPLHRNSHLNVESHGAKLSA